MLWKCAICGEIYETLSLAYDHVANKHCKEPEENYKQLFVVFPIEDDPSKQELSPYRYLWDR